MPHAIDDVKNVYRMMSKHLYNLEVELTQKYFLLKIPYLVVLGGIFLAELLFVSRSFT